MPILMAAAAGAAGGCQQPIKPLPLAPIPMIEATRLVNDNLDRIGGTLRASGSVDGYFSREDGTRQSYHVDGVLFYLAPAYVRFDLKALGERQFLFGSNAESYWYYNKADGGTHCGRHGEWDAPASEIPIRPDRIADAFGLTPIPGRAGLPDGIRSVQRVDDEYQQILYLAADEKDVTTLEKEYWLDRNWPRLVRRVVFRDSNGVKTMESLLDDYRPLSPGGPLLPHSMTADWPDAGSHLRFRVSRWAFFLDIEAGSVQFATPRECLEP